MATGRWKAAKLEKLNPKCLFCDTYTEKTIILRTVDTMVRGWRCFKCGFTIMHPEDIPKVMALLKQEMKIKKRYLIED